MNWYLKVLKKYAVFQGRAQRKEFWYFVLFNYLISLAFFMIDQAAGFSEVILGHGPLLGVYTLAVFLPEIAVTARRLHDTNHSGWWQLIIVPFLTLQWLIHHNQEFWALLIVVITLPGLMALLLWQVRDSDPGENRWGPNPKEELVAAEALSDTA